MITIKNAIDNVHRKYPSLLAVQAMRLDNGYFVFVKEKDGSKPEIGAAGLFVDNIVGDPEYAPLSFLAKHDTFGSEFIDISRFQTPEETRESNRG